MQLLFETFRSNQKRALDGKCPFLLMYFAYRDSEKFKIQV